MKFELDEKELEHLAELLADKLVTRIRPERSDKQLNKTDLIKKLKANKNDVDKTYINRPDFPKFQPDEGKDLRFSDKAVDEWLAKMHAQD